MHKIFNDEFRHTLDNQKRKRNLDADRVIEIINLRKDESFLDIGAGTGYFFVPAVLRSDSSNRMVAMDISEKMLEEIRNKLEQIPPQVELINADARHNNLETESIDKLMLGFVFHEFEQPGTYLREINRILKKNGHLYILEWLPVSSTSGPPMHERIAEEDLKDRLSEHGFTFRERYLLNQFNYLHIYTKNDVK